MFLCVLGFDVLVFGIWLSTSFVQSKLHWSLSQRPKAKGQELSCYNLSLEESMRRLIRICMFIPFMVLSVFPQSSSTASKSYPAPKFDINSIDKSVNPCDDFYQFACGVWLKNNPIPPDYTDWVSFTEVQEHNYTVLRDILEKTSANDPKRNPTAQKIGDFYFSCMDEQAANKKGYTPLKAEFDRITAVKDKTQMLELMAH